MESFYSKAEIVVENMFVDLCMFEVYISLSFQFSIAKSTVNFQL